MIKKKNGPLSTVMGVKAHAETTAGFRMNTGTSKTDAQFSVGAESQGPDMDINSADVIRAASTTLMAGVSAMRGKGQHN